MRYLSTKPTKATKSIARGFVMYSGPSMLNGDPILVIATMESSNAKTGNMVQTWIIAADLSPVEASKTGSDESVCGNCVHRHYKGPNGTGGGACYVNLSHAPRAAFDGYKRGIYPEFNYDDHARYFEGRRIRLGAYGDPAAVPFGVMQSIADLGSGHTGYTHQADHKNFDSRYFGLCQVSADSPKQAEKYQKLGGKTFRVAMAGDALAPTELECLADSKGLNCIDCMLCDGTSKNIAITVHGARKARFKTNIIKSISI